MIHAVLICQFFIWDIYTKITPLFAVNTSGVPRLTKFYTPVHLSVQTLVQKIFSLVYSRPVGLCNFLDAPELEPYLAQNEEGERWRVVYRSYATLYFVFVIDGAESELGILDLIQVCEICNPYGASYAEEHKGICWIAWPSLWECLWTRSRFPFRRSELDTSYRSLNHLIRNIQVHHILAEIIQGGLVLETNVDEIDNAGPYTSVFITLSFQCSSQ